MPNILIVNCVIMKRWLKLSIKEYVDSYIELLRILEIIPPQCRICGFDAQKIGCNYNPYGKRCPKGKRHMEEELKYERER